MLEDILKTTPIFSKQCDLIKKAWEEPQSGNKRLTIDSSIDEHASFCFHFIYKHNYKSNTPRTHHGIAHASRVALYVKVFYHLRRHDDESSVTLSERELKLLQLAALFHDSGREGDGVDRWDLDSAERLYHYLILLGATDNEAIQFAEVIANKDLKTNGEEARYNQLTPSIDGTVKWEKTIPHEKKSLCSELLHDADSADIIRARDQFILSYLDCYSKIVTAPSVTTSSGLTAGSGVEARFLDSADKPRNVSAGVAPEQLPKIKDYTLLNHFITEAKRLISYQGDASRRSPDQKERKESFFAEDCYTKTKAMVENGNFPTIRALLNGHSKHFVLKKFIEDKQHPDYYSESNIGTAIETGKLFFRGITYPRNYTQKSLDKSKIPGSGKSLESNAACDIYKMSRRIGIPTRASNKTLALIKDGNINRSLSALIGRGTSAYCSVGFGIINPSLSRIAYHFNKDSNTGVGSKKGIRLPKNKSESESSHEDTISNQIARYISYAEQGRLEYFHNSHNTLYSETIFYTLYDTDCDCIIYTNETVITDRQEDSIFNAIYLQSIFEKYTGRKLPIYQYSGNESSVRLVNTTDAALIDLWRKRISTFAINIDYQDILIDDYFDADSNTIHRSKLFYMPYESEKTSDSLYDFYSEHIKSEIRVLLNEQHHEFKKKEIAQIRELKNIGQFCHFSFSLCEKISNSAHPPIPISQMYLRRDPSDFAQMHEGTFEQAAQKWIKITDTDQETNHVFRGWIEKLIQFDDVVSNQEHSIEDKINVYFSYRRIVTLLNALQFALATQNAGLEKRVLQSMLTQMTFIINYPKNNRLLDFNKWVCRGPWFQQQLLVCVVNNTSFVKNAAISQLIQDNTNDILKSLTDKNNRDWAPMSLMGSCSYLYYMYCDKQVRSEILSFALSLAQHPRFGRLTDSSYLSYEETYLFTLLADNYSIFSNAEQSAFKDLILTMNTLGKLLDFSNCLIESNDCAIIFSDFDFLIKFIKTSSARNFDFFFNSRYMAFLGTVVHIAISNQSNDASKQLSDVCDTIQQGWKKNISNISSFVGILLEQYEKGGKGWAHRSTQEFMIPSFVIDQLITELENERFPSRPPPYYIIKMLEALHLSTAQCEKMYDALKIKIPDDIALLAIIKVKLDALKDQRPNTASIGNHATLFPLRPEIAVTTGSNHTQENGFPVP